MGWPFETTPNERKRERRSGYEHGLKGNSVWTNMSGSEYRKGAEAGYQKHRDNQKKQEERNKSNHKPQSNSNKKSSSSKKDRSSNSYNTYSHARYGGGSYGGYSSSSGYSSDTSGSNPVTIFFKLIGGFLGLFFLLSMCHSKSDPPSPANEILQQQEVVQQQPVKKTKKIPKYSDEPVVQDSLPDSSPSYSPAPLIEESKPTDPVPRTRTTDVDPSGL